MDIHVHHYVHNDVQDDIAPRLERIEQALKLLIIQGETLMALDAALAKRLDDATNAIANRMQKLLDAAKNQTRLTPEEEALIEADIARLENMGKDVANPLPA